MVDFWTYSCINCLRTLPYVKAWAEKYRDQGLVVIVRESEHFSGLITRMDVLNHLRRKLS